MSQHTETLATALLAMLDDEPFDMPSVFEALAPFLTPQEMVDLGANLELCPVHYCDAQICADDDETECFAARSMGIPRRVTGRGDAADTIIAPEVLGLIGVVVDAYEAANCVEDGGDDLAPLYDWLNAVNVEKTDTEGGESNA